MSGWMQDDLYWRDGGAGLEMGTHHVTYEMYRHDHDVYARRSTLRRGQLAYNMLCGVRPGLARSINATQLDPFYLDDRLPEFFTHIEQHWDDSYPDFP
jgi:hypothetical protein